MVYWVKNASAVFLETLAVPAPVKVPAPLITVAASGLNVPVTVKVLAGAMEVQELEVERVTLVATVTAPEALKLSFKVVPLVLLKFKMLKAVVCVVVPPNVVAAGVPGVLKFMVPPVVNVYGDEPIDVSTIQLPRNV